MPSVVVDTCVLSYLYNGHSLAENIQLGDVLADKAYLSRKNFKAVEHLGGTPFVPFKSNTVEPTEQEYPIWARMYYLYMYNRLTFMEHYHMRSKVESAFDDKGQVR
jgi:hypothetical protein